MPLSHFRKEETIEEHVAAKDAVIPVRWVGGVPPGTRLSKDDARVKAEPDAFVPVLSERGLTPENAYIARSTLRHIRGDGSLLVVHEGQMVSRDHELVAIQRSHFEFVPLEA